VVEVVRMDRQANQLVLAPAAREERTDDA
jgi:hypothetical protein